MCSQKYTFKNINRSQKTLATFAMWGLEELQSREKDFPVGQVLPTDTVSHYVIVIVNKNAADKHCGRKGQHQEKDAFQQSPMLQS